MKRIGLLAIFLLIFQISTFAQDDLIAAFRSSNVASIVKNCAPNVEYSLDGDSENLNKTQLEQKLKTFFTANKPLSFKLVHEGNAASSMHYSIGVMETKGHNYRITYYTKNNVIQQIAIAEE